MELQLENGNYTLPIEQHAKLKWSMHVLLLFMIGLFGAFLFLPIDGVYFNVAFKLIWIFAIAFFLYAWLFIGVLRLQTLKITQNGIEIRTAFGTKRANWMEIYDVQVFSIQRNTVIGLILKEQIKKRKQSFLSEINNTYGGMFSIRIPIAQFPSLDIETLYSTIRAQLKLQPTDLDLSQENQPEIEKQGEPNRLISILKLTLFVLLWGLVYGISIYLLKTNFILIPLFGLMFVLYFYQKNVHEEVIVWPIRFVVGLLCALQIFIAMITNLFLTASIPFSLRNLYEISSAYMMYLKDEPTNNMLVIGMAVALFAYGTFHGKTFRIVKGMSKFFMKRDGHYVYKRDGRIVEIYVINPVDFQDDETKFVVYLNEGCLIEREGKRVKALLLPLKAMSELSLTIMGSQIVQHGDEQYTRIDLGGTGSYVPYVFPCVLICSNNKEVELIRIELP
ncbi:hypothetical protein SAMN05518855_1005200 [Paenibacillus sp. CF384]|nr:hypothetical protein SAMN05518855_1005200 [Paenibacillus sp. CF384]